MDPSYIALAQLRRRKHKDCLETCENIFRNNPCTGLTPMVLKYHALSSEIIVDETELEDDGMAEIMLDDNKIADSARPGTSFRKPLASSGRGGQAVHPTNLSGRPVTGFARVGTQSSRPLTMEAAVKTARSGTAARPLTNATGRSHRLATSSMLNAESVKMKTPNDALEDPEFCVRYPAVARARFLYLLHVENDPTKALELAKVALKSKKGKNDWWWHAMVGMCHFRLNQVREAEENYLLSLQVRRTVLVTHFLANVHIKQDQPLRAIECYQQGLESPEGANDPTLTTAIARVYAAVGDNANAVAMYNAVLENDSTNAEAIACVAADCFYSDRPENALLLYRRLLQIGVSGPELLNNLGLSCFYAQQYDMAISCFERAISMTDDDTALAEIWYNIANVAINLGDIGLGYQCFKLAITCDPSHAEAYVNLGVLEHRKGNLAPAMAHYDSALRLAPQLYEPHYNKAVICSTQGDMQGCFQSATNAHEVFGAHRGSQALLKDLRSLFAMV
eukprot:m.997891 g.997891  ORF g.997891 m.997891 type:complete len:507 (-) comp24023_c0_seq10:689-2209(-)